jgi:PEP-CTERM motif
MKQPSRHKTTRRKLIMKKLILLALCLAWPLAASAQGRVNFANNSLSLIQTNGSLIGLSDGPASRSVTPLRVGLFIGAPGENNPQNLVLAANNVGGGAAWATNLNAPLAGRFIGGNIFEIQGNTGTPISFQVRAWSLGYNTYAEAYSAWSSGVPGVWQGVSQIGSVTPATGLTVTPSLFGSGAGQIGGFFVYPLTPEPSTIALGLLGVGVLALFRRRK